MATNSDLDLTIVSSLDQPVPFDAGDVLKDVELYVQKSLDALNPDIAFAAGATLIKGARLAGIGLAKLAYLMLLNWPKYQIDMDYYDAAMERWGLAQITLERYIRVWGMFDSGEVPEKVIQPLLQRPMQDLNAIATTFESGYPIDDEKWEKLANAASGNEVLETMRDVKGVPPRKNTLSLKMGRDGTLYAWYQGQSYNLGWLDVGDSEENEVVDKAIKRILSGAGIVRE